MMRQEIIRKACIEWMGETFAVVRYLDWDASGLYEKPS